MVLALLLPQTVKPIKSSHSDRGWQVEKIARFDQLTEIKDQWDELAKASAFPSVFGLYGFAAAWWHAFGNEWRLCAWVVKDPAGCVRLIAPFISHPSTPQAWYTLGHGAADYEAVIVCKGDCDAIAVFSAWFQSNLEWKTLALNHCALSNFFPLVPTIERSPKRWWNAWRLLSTSYPAGYFCRQEQHPFLDAEQIRSQALNTHSRNFKKHENWFNSRGKLQYKTLREPSDIKAYADRFSDLHIKKWEQKNSPSSFKQASHRTFLSALTNQLAPQGFIRLDLMLWDGQLIAGHYGFEWKKRLYWYLTTYDPAVGSHSPGKLLLANALRDAERDGIQEFDFLRGNENYKYLYTKQTRPTLDGVFYRSRSALAQQKLAHLGVVLGETCSPRSLFKWGV